MFEKRTDLALEVHELRGKDSGIEVNETIKNEIKITTAIIKDGQGESNSGKRAGKYITLDVGKIWRVELSRFNSLVRVVSDEINKLLPKTEGTILVAGLGNEQITSDSLGPKVVKKLLVTRHIKIIDEELYNTAKFGSLAAIAPGVLGQTGIESAEIIKSIVDKIKPKCVILIDSLASRRLNRLATTIQISDNGISPGSGVSNKRIELSESYIGVPIVSVGIPMVVDAATLAYDLLEEHYGGVNESFKSVIEKILVGNGKDMFVTPKDNDIIAEKTANLLSSAINIATHNMRLDELQEYLS